MSSFFLALMSMLLRRLFVIIAHLYNYLFRFQTL